MNATLNTIRKEDLRARTQRRHEIQQHETARVLGDLNAALGRRDVPIRHGSPLLIALAPIGRRMGVTFRSPPESATGERSDDSIDAVANASRVRMRQVGLSGKWWQENGGDLLGSIEDRPVALLGIRGAYELFDPHDGTQRRVDRKLASQVSSEAVAFCRTLPDETRSVIDLAKFALASRKREIATAICLSLAATLLGMFAAQATGILVDTVIPNSNSMLALHFALGLMVTALGIAMFHISQGLITLGLQTSVTAEAQSAIWDRILKLPAGFFRKFTAGDLMNRAMMVSEVSREISGNVLRTMLTGLLAVVNVGLLFYYSATLAWIAVLIALGWSGLTIPITLLVRRKSLAYERLSGRMFGFVVQVLGGMPKIRVAGAEQRAFNEWGRRFATQLRLTADIARLQDFARIANFILPTISTMLLFWCAAEVFHLGSTAPGRSSMGTFLAFHVAFGVFIQGITSAGNILVDVVDSFAKSRLIEPILRAQPEVDATKVHPGQLEGKVELRNVSFRYQAGGPQVLDGVSLQAEPGEFVAIVGASGSGKSTILRLLLGFETPESGIIKFDNQELSTLDVSAVRRQMGGVMQNDRINTGSIFGNITLGHRVSLEEAWQAACDVGFDEDIKRMPMGMHSMINEGGTNLSGGQRQRLLLARALVGNPSILLLDEATSALDNRTQSIVSRSIERRRITRITIAHRLSTIEHADRIFVMDGGRVIQHGSFDELSNRDGNFQDLLRRQIR